MIVTRRWPADPASVPQAHRFAADTARGLLPERVAPLELMVCELVTNSVVHAHTPFQLRIQTTPREVRLAVTDQRPGTVHPQRAAPDQPHGRGLQIVSTLSDRWGVTPNGAGGKTVWFALTL